MIADWLPSDFEFEYGEVFIALSYLTHKMLVEIM